MENNRKFTLEVHTLLWCADESFLATMGDVLNQFRLTPTIVGDCDDALRVIEGHAFDVIVVDWREIENLGDFLRCVRRSRLNPDCVLVAIVRDLVDLRQAFAAGVHFLIHKPASALQIERCLRAAYCATVARRRKRHRESVSILAAIGTHGRPFTEAAMVNLSEGGACLRIGETAGLPGMAMIAGEEIELDFFLPATGSSKQRRMAVSATVIWTTGQTCGVQFRHISEAQRLLLECWLTSCVERTLAEVCTGNCARPSPDLDKDACVRCLLRYSPEVAQAAVQDTNSASVMALPAARLLQ
ncbi:MAG TPA: response regulator [Candidatus Sulfotelmatobacter sp.]|jgi:CheY-like chemotaxis protein|nr:response regulator [Candidatus Sulfotelmatobacter sp.]